MKRECTCFNSGTNCFSGSCNVCNKPKVKITITEAMQLQELCEEANVLKSKTFNYLISHQKGMKHITINGIKYLPEDKRSLFERFYDSITNLISNGKSFAPNELKTFR